MFPVIVTLASGLVAQPTPRKLTDASLLWKRCGMGHTARLLVWPRHPRSATQESVQPLGPKLHPSVASDAKLGRPARGHVAGGPPSAAHFAPGAHRCIYRRIGVHNSNPQLYWALAARFPPSPRSWRRGPHGPDIGVLSAPGSGAAAAHAFRLARPQVRRRTRSGRGKPGARGLRTHKPVADARLGRGRRDLAALGVV